jgi:hypothetical protein
MQERIQAWLDSSQHFLVGRALYNTYGNDQELKALFAKGQSKWAAERLAEALQELATGTPPKVLNDEYHEMPAADDPILKSLQLQWKPLYSSMKYKTYELDKYAGDDAASIAIRRKLAFEILDLERQCMAIWGQRDYFIEHGELPEAKKIKAERPTDPVALARYIEALKKRLRRNKANLKKQPENVLYADLLKRDEAEMKEITDATS